MNLKKLVAAIAVVLSVLPGMAQGSEYIVTVKDAAEAKWNGTKPYAAIALTRRFERMTVREAEVNGRNVLLISVTHVMPAHPLAKPSHHTTGRELKKTCELSVNEICTLADEDGMEIVRIKQVAEHALALSK